MLSLVVMMLALGIYASTAEVPTYQLEDPATGRILTCTRCPAGYHMRSHCTPTQDTVCSRCPEHHFTQFWNYLPKCLYCSTFCVENQYVKKECSPTNNRVCECQEGYYWQADFCIKHTECPSGYGVQKNGTVHSDTNCEKCPRGTFSATKSSSAPCVKHTDCASMDLVVALKGTGWHDNICVACETLQIDGGITVLKQIMQNIFAHEKIRLSKLSRILRHGLGQRLQGKRSLFSRRQFLLYSFFEWIRGARIDQLRELPKMLEERNIRNTAEKILKEFDASNCLMNDTKMSTTDNKL
ncbi:tumor necrosis factor receptor superfamily member 11B-like [Xyrauchen texanus]|uniref:tumor necrosis factor receptor superfamily member 11B-like n=1 Tax=Xyrauchen texanus TaxID=154827 RepID=UPI002242B94A|nr:tumor necrosis factor receptor superfamily member 11B-like [Xyrauchen texanus]